MNFEISFQALLITVLSNYSTHMIHLLIILFVIFFANDNVETVKFFINSLFCAPFPPKIRKVRRKENTNSDEELLREREGETHSERFFSATLGRRFFLTGFTFSSLH